MTDLLAAGAVFQQHGVARASYCPHTPHPKQQEFLGIDVREALFGGAAGGGKSDVLLMAALEHVHVPDYAAILFRRTHTDLALPGAIMDRSHEWLSSSDARWHDQTKTWHFPSGATLTFGYLDGPRDRFRYQGAEFQFVGFDELTQFLERDYLYLFSRLRRTHKQADIPLRVRAASNPGDVGHRWVKKRFVDGPHPDRAFIPSRVEDNPSTDLEAYRASLANLDRTTRLQLEEGQWIEDTSTLVYQVDEARDVIDELPSLPQGETWLKVLGMDFGVTDPTAFAVLYFTIHDPCAYLVESDEWPGMIPSDAAEMYRSWEDRHGAFTRVVGDVGGLGKAFSEEMIRRHHIPVEAAEKPNKLGFIKLMNGDYQRGHLKIIRSGNETYLRDVAGLIWKDDKHQTEHPGQSNHTTDAALYGYREARHYAARERERTEKEKPEAERWQERIRRQHEEAVSGRVPLGSDDDEYSWVLGGR